MKTDLHTIKHRHHGSCSLGSCLHKPIRRFRFVGTRTEATRTEAMTGTMAFRSIFIAIILLLSAAGSFAQDINFTQFYELPLLRNSALAGLFKGDVRVMSAMRSQWGSVTVPYQTQALGAEIRIPFLKNDFFCAGVQLTNDIAGDSKLGRTQLLGMLAFNKCLNEDHNTFLSIGVLGGAVQQRFDPTNLKFDDQFVNGTYSASNPTQQTFASQKLRYPDFNTGLSLSSEIGNTQCYIGAAYFHLNQPMVAFDPNNDFLLNKKLVFNAGLNIPSGYKNRIIIYLDVFMQGGNHQGQGGFLFKHDLYEPEDEEMPQLCISAGSFYRWKDAVIPVIKFDYYKWTLGVSYDVNISKLKPASQLRGAYEVTLCYRDFIEAFSNRSDKTRCPVKF